MLKVTILSFWLWVFQELIISFLRGTFVCTLCGTRRSTARFKEISFPKCLFYATKQRTLQNQFYYHYTNTLITSESKFSIVFNQTHFHLCFILIVLLRLLNISRLYCPVYAKAIAVAFVFVAVAAILYIQFLFST